MLFAIQPINWLNIIILAGFLIPIVIIDIKKHIIPDILVLPGAVALLIAMAIVDLAALPLALLNGAIAFAVIALFWLLSKKKIGFGDAKLSFLMAAAIGLIEWWICLFIASLAALSTGLILVKWKKITKTDKIPLAPFFAFGLAGVIVLKLLGFFTIINIW